MSLRTYHLISPNGEVKTAEYEDELEYACIPFPRMCKMLGFPEGTLLAHINMLWRGKRAHMFVDEEGLLRNPPLPINAKATRVYWNASWSDATGKKYDNLAAPTGDINDLSFILAMSPIVGPALLWEGELE